MQIGERRLLPAARNAERDTIIMADGFSCKTQIEQGTDRRALHTAQVIKLAMDYGSEGTSQGERPEQYYPDIVLDGYKPDLKAAVALGVGATVAGGALAWGLKRRLG
jgi:hypothetical protein